MKRILLIVNYLFAAMFALESYAQNPEGEILYTQELIMGVEGYERADSNDQTLNWVKNPIIVDNIDGPIAELPVSGFFVDIKKWILVREKNQTVMHCYFVMPEYPCKGLWLGGDETFIVDAKTGIHYQARGTYDKALWNKNFALNLPKGTFIDLPIYFPPLPESVTDIYIYGVPRWTSNGGTILHLESANQKQVSEMGYNQFKLPRLAEQRGPFDKDDMDTYDVYEDIQLIQPTKEHTMTIWLTPDATYLAVAYEMNWNREYFGFSSRTVLIDERTRNMYKIRRIMGNIPFDRQFFISGKAGDWIAFLLEFEPLPFDETYIKSGMSESISYSEPEATPFDVWGADWTSSFYDHLDVRQLIENRTQFLPFERTIVK